MGDVLRPRPPAVYLSWLHLKDKNLCPPLTLRIFQMAGQPLKTIDASAEVAQPPPVEPILRTKHHHSSRKHPG